ncbi:hypothetical protein HispidOSU_021139 [Sigmodon hispidus]
MLAALSAPAAAQSQGSSSREVSRLSDAARSRGDAGPRPPAEAMVGRREPLPLQPPPTSRKLSPRRWECWESRRRASRPSPALAGAAACRDSGREANGPGNGERRGCAGSGFPTRRVAQRRPSVSRADEDAGWDGSAARASPSNADGRMSRVTALSLSSPLLHPPPHFPYPGFLVKKTKEKIS